MLMLYCEHCERDLTEEYNLVGRGLHCRTCGYPVLLMCEPDPPTLWEVHGVTKRNFKPRNRNIEATTPDEAIAKASEGKAGIIVDVASVKPIQVNAPTLAQMNFALTLGFVAPAAITGGELSFLISLAKQDREQLPELPPYQVPKLSLTPELESQVRMAVDDEVKLPPIRDIYDGYYELPSYLEPGQLYRINPHDLSCTCPEWRERRGMHSPGDIRRVCRHIFQELCELEIEKEFDIPIRLALRQLRCCENVCRLSGPLGTLIMGKDLDSDWVNVTGLFQGTPVVAGWNLHENRWAYDERPAGDKIIALCLKSLVENNFIKI